MIPGTARRKCQARSPLRARRRVVLKIPFVVALCVAAAPPDCRAECVWTVGGELRVLDNVFVAGAAEWKPLAGVQVKVSASTLAWEGWTHWGTVTSDAAGRYQVAVVPAQSSPQGCRRKRRIRVRVDLTSDEAVISRDQIQPFTIHATNTDHWYRNSDPEGRSVAADVRLETMTDLPGTILRELYTATRAAQMYAGYRKLHLQLREWSLDPPRGRVRWPAAVGWSPPGGWVHIDRAWFTKSAAWIRRELTHEYLHQWWYRHLYTPSIDSGRRWGDTHEFLETPALALFEEAAEVQAVRLNDVVFGIPGSATSLLTSRAGIRCRFATAETRGGNSYFKPIEVQQLIDADGPEWRYLLMRADTTVGNYLALLLTPTWYALDFDLHDGTGCTGPPRPDPEAPMDKSCAGLPSPMLDVREMLDAMLRWGAGGIRASDRSIAGFYQYLGTASPYAQRFAPHWPRFWNFGNPRFSGLASWNGVDACTGGS